MENLVAAAACCLSQKCFKTRKKIQGFKHAMLDVFGAGIGSLMYQTTPEV